MKKTLLAIIVTAAFALVVSAAPQFSNITPNEGSGIVMNKDGNLTLSFIRSNGSAANYSSSYPSGYNMFGYYTLDDKGNILSKKEIDLSKLKDGQIDIGDFKAGDRIAFWAGDAGGDYMESMHRDNVEKGTTRDSAYVGNNGQKTTITMGIITENGWGPEKMKGINDNTNYIFQISGSSGSIGQPLPGVAVGLLIGGAVLGAVALRRKYQAKKL